MRPRWCISMASHFACSPTDPSRPLRRTPSRSFQGIPLPYPTRMANKASDFRRFQQGEIEKEGVFCFTLKRRFWKLMPYFGRLSHRSYLLSKSANLSLLTFGTVTPNCHSKLSLLLSPLTDFTPLKPIWEHKIRASSTRCRQCPSKAIIFTL